MKYRLEWTLAHGQRCLSSAAYDSEAMAKRECADRRRRFPDNDYRVVPDPVAARIAAQSAVIAAARKLLASVEENLENWPGADDLRAALAALDRETQP